MKHQNLHYHNKTKNFIEQANNCIDIFKLFKNCEKKLPENYNKVYFDLLSLNKAAPRKYKEKFRPFQITKEHTVIKFD